MESTGCNWWKYWLKIRENIEYTWSLVWCGKQSETVYISFTSRGTPLCWREVAGFSEVEVPVQCGVSNRAHVLAWTSVAQHVCVWAAAAYVAPFWFVLTCQVLGLLGEADHCLG